MHCPRCQHENPATAKFCLECGARLALVCSRCATELPPEAKYCFNCGQAVSASIPSRLCSPQTYTPQHLAEKILSSKGAMEENESMAYFRLDGCPDRTRGIEGDGRMSVGETGTPNE